MPRTRNAYVVFRSSRCDRLSLLNAEMIQVDRVNGVQLVFNGCQASVNSPLGSDKFKTFSPGWKIFLAYRFFNGAVQGMNGEFIRTHLTVLALHGAF